MLPNPSQNLNDFMPQRTSPSLLSADMSEAQMHETSLRNRSLELTPPHVPDLPPIGTWVYQECYGYVALWQLREIPIARLIRREYPAFTTFGKSVILKYARWEREGHQMPPIKVVETNRGNLNVIDGHHRIEARLVNREHSISAWVSSVFYSYRDGDGRLCGWGLTRNDISELRKSLIRKGFLSERNAWCLIKDGFSDWYNSAESHGETPAGLHDGAVIEYLGDCSFSPNYHAKVRANARIYFLPKSFIQILEVS